MACFANTYCSFQLLDLVNDMWKKYYLCYLHHGDARIYQESQQTRHTKQIVYKNFQFFQPLIIIPSCVLNLERETEHDTDIAYVVCMH